jgi:prepilin-type N-terminal cleavage/methylation domain-containing protein
MIDRQRSMIEKKRRGFTVVEMILCMIIMAIIAKIGVDVISRTESNQRADRAARETVVALRYARNLATTTGNSSGVEIDTSTRKIRVYTMIGTTKTFVSAPFMGNGGAFQIDLANDRAVKGVTLTMSIPSDTSNPHDVLFNSLGATKNTGTVRFNYGSTYKTVTIGSLADPTIN